MDLNCSNCQEQVEKYLCDIPSAWRKQIAYVICEGIVAAQDPSCEDLKKCQTLTTLSAFSINDCEISIVFKDENGNSVTRFFDYCNIIQSSLDGIDPQCLTSAEDWAELTHEERLQLIINRACERLA